MVETVALLASFGIIALASGRIGRAAVRTGLPLISGFLVAGVIAGPYVLDLIPGEAAERLRFLDEVSLAFIAFAAGSELYVQELRSRLVSITRITLGNAIIIPLLGALTVFLMADLIPFLSEMGTAGRIGVSLLAGAILVARSPSSVIAIVTELRAKGPFTQTIMGVTMVIDVVVIVIFAMSLEIADALLTEVPFSLGFVALLAGELLLSAVLGIVLGTILIAVLNMHVNRWIKTGLILLLGYLVFVITTFIRDYSHQNLPVEILLEPLLVAMIGSFLVTNRLSYRSEWRRILHEIGPSVYVIFFTLTGASLALDVVAQTWQIALALFGVRLLGILVGSFGGGVAAGDPSEHNRLGWLTYVTMAGVGLGLAAEVAVQFPGWGTAFATTIISVIVLSQLVGPPLIKFAISRIGEAHPRAEMAGFDGVRDVVIFGVESQSVALARQLTSHGWQVRMVCFDTNYTQALGDAEMDVRLLDDVDLGQFQALELANADAIVTMLTDEENYRICELVYEHFGIETIVVRLNNWANFDRFHELGALIVEPNTALVSLMDQFVRSPTAASLLLGRDTEHEVVDLQVCDPDLEGVPLRDLRLPLDTVILSVQRDGHSIVSHGYTRLRTGDRVTVVGSHESLEQLALRFEE